MKKQTLFLILFLFVMAAVVTGCARIEARERRGIEKTPEISEPAGGETPEQASVLKDSGRYAGVVGADQIQVKISGVPEEIPPRLFQVSKKAREQLSALQEGDEIIIVFLPMGETPPLILEIGRL